MYFYFSKPNNDVWKNKSVRFVASVPIIITKEQTLYYNIRTLVGGTHVLSATTYGRKQNAYGVRLNPPFYCRDFSADRFHTFQTRRSVFRSFDRPPQSRIVNIVPDRTTLAGGQRVRCTGRIVPNDYTAILGDSDRRYLGFTCK